MESLLEGFITETGSLLSSFTTSIGRENENMVELKKSKMKFFDEISAGRNQLASIISNFTVFPDGFQSKCTSADQNIKDLQKIGSEISEFISKMKESQENLIQKKKNLLKERNISSWEIKNTNFVNLIKNFTITAHKEAAGKLAGMEIEKGAASGEVTFF